MVVKVRVSKHAIACQNHKQAKAAKAIADNLPAGIIADNDFAGTVFFAEPKDRLAIALKRKLNDIEISNLEAAGLKLVRYTFWDDDHDRLSCGVFTY